jgi:hypothetical protein
MYQQLEFIVWVDTKSVAYHKYDSEYVLMHHSHITELPKSLLLCIKLQVQCARHKYHC